jgi:hypothetical protein
VVEVLGCQSSQMHSVENLRGIPTNGPLTQGSITAIWNQFYATYPNATLQQILDKVKSIDDQFGHYFVPPIR